MILPNLAHDFRNYRYYLFSKLKNSFASLVSAEQSALVHCRYLNKTGSYLDVQTEEAPQLAASGAGGDTIAELSTAALIVFEGRKMTHR